MGVISLPKFLNSTKPNQIDVFAWGAYFANESIIEEFEKESGIKVKLHIFTSNEEMRVKLLANKGAYDLVIPSDYAVTNLIREGELQKLDHSKLNFLDSLAPQLLHLDYDPDNEYSIPHTWETYGLGVDKEELAHMNIEPSLSSVFNSKVINYTLAMTPDPGEAIIFAANYLYGDVKSLSKEQADGVRDLLREQKGWTEAYADYRSRYLIQTKNCPLALVRSSFMWEIAREQPFMTFLPPKEATFITIENLAIPKHSKKSDLAYQFLNYLYQPHVQAKQVGPAPVNPAVPAALPLTNEVEGFYTEYNRALDRGDFVFFRRLLTEEETRSLWVDLKANKPKTIKEF